MTFRMLPNARVAAAVAGNKQHGLRAAKRRFERLAVVVVARANLHALALQIGGFVGVARESDDFGGRHQIQAKPEWWRDPVGPWSR